MLDDEGINGKFSDTVASLTPDQSGMLAIQYKIIFRNYLSFF